MEKETAWFSWQKGVVGDWYSVIDWINKPKAATTFNTNKALCSGVIPIVEGRHYILGENGTAIHWDEIYKDSPRPKNLMLEMAE